MTLKSAGSARRYPCGVIEVAYRRTVGAVASRRGVAGKYVIVSILNVVNHQVLLNIANSGWGWSGGRSNLFAAVIAAVPAYLLSRFWVWEVRGPHQLRAEIIPFWGLALIGLVVSTTLAEAADRALGSGVWVAAGSLVGYFLVWLAKFVVLDGLFTRAAARNPSGSGGG